MTNRKLMRRKMMQVGGSTILSRFFGVLREILMVQYLGAGILSDAFITAFKIPNSLRKIFAEGAMSVALVPTLVSLIKNNKREEVNSVMTLSFIIFQGILFILCAVIFFNAETVIRIIAPGWYINDMYVPQAIFAINFLKILISFIIFLSSSALLAGALQSVNQFFIPAFGQVLMNIVIIIGLLIGLAKQLPVTYFCYVILCAGFAQFLMHLAAYFYMNLSFGLIDKTTWHTMKKVLTKFVPCLLSMSVAEINLVLSTSLGTFLQAGSISLIYYANRFMGIPLGIFATAFSTVLLPHFARVNTYAPKRLSFFLFEAAKLIVWITVPATIYFSSISKKLFNTLYSQRLTVNQMNQASTILVVFLAGLFFFSLNKILLNLYYAQHNTRIPLFVSIIVTIANFGIGYFWLMPQYGAVGLALAMTITTGLMQTALLAFGLMRYFAFILYLTRFAKFLINFLWQLSALILVYYVSYQISIVLFSITGSLYHFFIDGYGFWLWNIPLATSCAYLFWRTNQLFNIQLYFLE